MDKPVRVFISYAREDEPYRIELEKRLKQLQRQKLIEIWYDRRIAPGDEWVKKIDQHLNDAEVILILTSPDFLASDYCHDAELQRALEKHSQGTARVIPIIVRPSGWMSTPLGKLQALPADGKPISTWDNQDEAWVQAEQGIRELIEQVISKPRGPHQNRPLVAIGPNIIAPGSIEGTQGNRWNIRLDGAFVMGSLPELTRFGREFTRIDRLDRYLLLEEYGEGYTLAEAPEWSKDQEGISLRIATEPMIQRTQIQDLGQDVAFKRNDNGKYDFEFVNGDVKMVGGVERIAQLLRNSLTYKLGSWKANRRLGSRLHEFYERFGVSSLFEHLMALELIRMAFSPEDDAFTFITRVCSVKDVKPERFDGWYEADVSLELHGVQEPWRGRVNFVLPQSANSKQAD